jgi:pimeloyl-ACP methyl ester carboxylesterase
MALPGTTERGIYFIDLPGPAVGPGAAKRAFLLVHGLGGSLDFWVAVAPALAAHGRVVALDVPGFARSKRPKGPLTLDSVAGAIIQFCRENQLADLTIVAHSMGGLIGLKMAALAPDLWRRLILVDGTPILALDILKKPRKGWRNPKLAFTLTMQFVAGIAPLRRTSARLIMATALGRILTLWPFVARPARLDRRIAAEALSHTGGGRVVFRALKQGRRVDLRELIRAVDGPIELVRGDRDRMNQAADFELVRELARKVTRVDVVPECGHWPLIEHPKRLVDFILTEEE